MHPDCLLTLMRSSLHTIAYRLWQVRQQLGFVVPLSAAEYSEVVQWLPNSALPLFQTMSDADQRHSLRVCQGLLERGCVDRDLLAAALLHDVGKAQGRVPFWTRPAIVLGKKLAPQLLSRLVLYPKTGSPSRWDPIMQMNKLTGSSVGSDLSRPSPIYRPPEKSPPSPPSLHQFVKPHYRVPRGAGQGPSMVGAIPCGRPVPVLADGRPAPTSAHDPLAPGHDPLVPAHGRPAPGPDYPTTTIPKWRQSLSNAWYHAEIGADLASAAGLSDHAVLYIRTHHQPGGPAAELHEVDEVS